MLGVGGVMLKLEFGPYLASGGVGDLRQELRCQVEATVVPPTTSDGTTCREPRTGSG